MQALRNQAACGCGPCVSLWLPVSAAQYTATHSLPLLCRWDDVAGLEGAKDALKEAVILPVKFPQVRRLGAVHSLTVGP